MSRRPSSSAARNASIPGANTSEPFFLFLDGLASYHIDKKKSSQARALLLLCSISNEMLARERRKILLPSLFLRFSDRFLRFPCSFLIFQLASEALNECAAERSRFLCSHLGCFDDFPRGFAHRSSHVRPCFS